ncbi:uncharacterized protein [Spinacia oleracea]|uniref:Aspartic peptidase DDI1-type domain-containing protein n=1 Tax=Spinacia oleracea TaxID=3562 RepID=A0ABM3RQ32_SPIOL|nr:uncharacterized protein LOC130471557 [Spinacia oleracea]
MSVDVDFKVSASGPVEKVVVKVVMEEIQAEKVVCEKEATPEVKKETGIQVPPIALSFPNWQLKSNLDKQFGKFLDVVKNLQECSALLQNKSPPKLKDLGSFSNPYNIGNVFIDKALCDIGASVSVMPLSACTKLKMGELKVTNITLQMADRSVKYPLGILEDVPVRVGKLYIPVDFVVLDK